MEFTIPHSVIYAVSGVSALVSFFSWLQMPNYHPYVDANKNYNFLTKEECFERSKRLQVKSYSLLLYLPTSDTKGKFPSVN